MNAVVFGIITFLMGYFAEKIMDLVLGKISVLQKTSITRKMHKHFTSRQYIDIQPLINVYPYFLPHNITVKTDKSKELYLALPKEYKTDFKQDNSFHENDVLFKTLSIFGIEDAEVKEAIETARLNIAQKFASREDGLYFNGKKYGIFYADGFSRTTDSSENPILHIELFETDHYTSRVISEAFRLLDFDKNIITFERLNSDLNWLRTSLGLSIIVVLKSTNEIILTHRSPSASYSEGKRWIYVSATETLTETDIDSYTQKVDLLLCLERGILEELGIRREMYIESSVRFYESFFETHFLQDGIVASIELKDTITFDCVESLPAKDKQMEVYDMFTLPNSRKAISSFISENKDHMRRQTIYALEAYAARL